MEATDHQVKRFCRFMHTIAYSSDHSIPVLVDAVDHFLDLRVGQLLARFSDHSLCCVCQARVSCVHARLGQRAGEIPGDEEEADRTCKGAGQNIAVGGEQEVQISCLL